jgi:hypothetical protein
MQALALYVGFLGAAWLVDRAILQDQMGLLRLAVPVAMVLLGLILDDTYTRSKRRSSLDLARGPVLGIALALLSQAAFRLGNSRLAVPYWIVFYGCAMSLLLSSAIRMLFSPVTDQLQGANAPALWLKQTGGSPGNGQIVMVQIAKAIFTIVALAGLAAWLANRYSLPQRRMGALVLVLFIAYQAWRLR